MFYYSKPYINSPIFLQHALVTLKGISYAFAKRGQKFFCLEKELLRNEKMDSSELGNLQLERLKEIITHAFKNVPFYKKLFNNIGFKPQELQSIEDLDRLPILDKETVRKQLGEFVASNINRHFLVQGSTSGSTGSPLSLFMDRNLIQSEHAFVWRQFRWAGCPRPGKMALFRADMIVHGDQKKPPYWRYDAFSKELWFSSYHLSEDTSPVYLNRLQTLDPNLIYSLPSTIFQLAKFIETLGLRLSLPSLRGIVTSSETLYEYQKILIERIFGVNVFDWYGCFERVIFIGTCEYGSHHLFPDYGVTEFVPVAEFEGTLYYELVGTGFCNWVTPLIRYRTGDIVTLTESPCQCGRRFPRVGSIIGHLADLIITPDGRVMGSIDIIFKNIQHIKLAQIVQESLDQFKVLIIPDKNYDISDERKIIQNAHTLLGRAMKIDVNCVEHIPRLPNGKFKVVVSKIKV
jgi:phenylacetate-CoA ligase